MICELNQMLTMRTDVKELCAVMFKISAEEIAKHSTPYRGVDGSKKLRDFACIEHMILGAAALNFHISFYGKVVGEMEAKYLGEFKSFPSTSISATLHMSSVDRYLDEQRRSSIIQLAVVFSIKSTL